MNSHPNSKLIGRENSAPGRSPDAPIRVLHSFPLKLGAERICTIAWHQVDGLAAAGAEVIAFPAASLRPLPSRVKVLPTLARGKFYVPNRLLGKMAYAGLHDWIVSRRIEKMAGQIDIIHTWPLGALCTLKTARRLGIPTVLERPNAHTQFAYEVVEKECQLLGINMPAGHEHAFNADFLRREEAEYEIADRLLCPSDFVAGTFVEKGFAKERLARHQYGFDEQLFFPSGALRNVNRGLTMLFTGGCAPRKGLHYALEAWLQSPAHKEGTFLIAGKFIPGYAEKLSPMLAHPSVKILGHRNDVPMLMQSSDILVLPSIEEGSALVTSEARGCGCVLLVSAASGAICKHMENALVHQPRDAKTLAQHITLLHENRTLLERLRAASLSNRHEMTWSTAGEKLLQVYRETIAMKQAEATQIRVSRARQGKSMA
jgi:glycosyltransferase involved in cell wall biosynthesis